MVCRYDRTPNCYPPTTEPEGHGTYTNVAVAFTEAALVGFLVGTALALAIPGVGGVLIGVFSVGFMAVFAVYSLISGEGRVKCNAMEGTPSCVAGVITRIERSFSETGDGIFPFLAWHNLVHVLVTSYYWERLEEGGCRVLCTQEGAERNSALVQCFFYDPRVCSAYNGGVVGLAVGAIVGVIAGIAVAAAIGCATLILCLLALLAAIIVAIICAILGAIAGGHAGKAAGEDEPDVFEEAGANTVGELVTFWGNLSRVGDQKIFWFVDEAATHGMAATTQNNPYCYCEIDDELPVGADGGCSEIY